MENRSAGLHCRWVDSVLMIQAKWEGQDASPAERLTGNDSMAWASGK